MSSGGSELVKTKRIGRWYFGGCASAMAACCTHPLDLVKVHLQTVSAGGETVGMSTMFVRIAKHQGVRALYNGISASLLRQLTYSTTRFGMYETIKKEMTTGTSEPMSFLSKVGAAGLSGGCGGIVGTPADMVNVRMQNDIKLPVEQRRNYKHAIDGLFRVFKEEGLTKMFSGATMATSRAILMTIGQLSMYDQVKETLLKTGLFGDNLITHFTSSTIASTIATAITQPLDVMKTKMMNSKPDEFKGISDCVLQTAKMGPLAFYKGFIPAFIRLGPHTILTFIFFEQIKKHFGQDVPVDD